MSRSAAPVRSSSALERASKPAPRSITANSLGRFSSILNFNGWFAEAALPFRHAPIQRRSSRQLNVACPYRRVAAKYLLCAHARCDAVQNGRDKYPRTLNARFTVTYRRINTDSLTPVSHCLMPSDADEAGARRFVLPPCQVGNVLIVIPDARIVKQIAVCCCHADLPAPASCRRNHLVR